MKMSILSVAVVGGLALTSGAMAQSWPESGDAGDMPGTAQMAAGLGALTNITGAVSAATDADMFAIYIDNPAIFSATTATLPGTMSDTTLYLFNLDGTGIAKNDDASGSSFLSTLAAGDPKFTALTPGVYLLAVGGFAFAPYWNEPPADFADLVFDVNTYTGVLAPQAGATAIAGWVDVGTYSTGTYNITLTGASAVPAPGSIALVAAGGLIAIRRRRA